MKFADLVLSGQNPNIEDFVEEWHLDEDNDELYEYLGVTLDEYERFVEGEDLAEVVKQRKKT